MSPLPRFPLFRSTFITMCVASSLVAQEDHYGRARELLRNGSLQAALEHVGKACAEEADSLDRLDLHIRILIAMGDMTAAKQAQEKWSLLVAQKAAANAAAMRGPAPSPSPSPANVPAPGTSPSRPAPGPRPPVAGGGAGGAGRGAADAASPGGQPPAGPVRDKQWVRGQADAAIATANAGNQEDAELMVQSLVTADMPTDSAPEVVEQLKRLANSPNPRLAAAAKRALVVFFERLVDVAGALLAKEAGAEADSQIASSEVASGALQELGMEEEALAPLQRLLRLGVPRVTAYVLRRGERLLGVWASKIERHVAANEADAASQAARYRQAVESLHGESDATAALAARRLGIVGSKNLARSGVTTLADAYQPLLAAWAKQHAARAAALQAAPQPDERAMADENEMAAACDDGQGELGLAAARQRGAEGDLLAAAKLYKALQSSPIASVAAQARDALEAMWNEQRAKVADVPKLGPTSSPRDAFAWLEEIAARLPALGGSHLDRLADSVRDGLFKEAQDTLEALAKQSLVATAPAAAAGGPPTQGRPFVAAALGMSFVWIPAGDDQLGFWCATTNPTPALWDSLYPGVAIGKSTDGTAIEPSWNYATELCGRLSDMEREAKRLPTGYRYSLPTSQQVRLARAAMKLPAASPRLWTTDLQGLKWPGLGQRLVVTLDPNGKAEALSPTSNAYGIGTLIVLVPEVD